MSVLNNPVSLRTVLTCHCAAATSTFGKWWMHDEQVLLEELQTHETPGNVYNPKNPKNPFLPSPEPKWIRSSMAESSHHNISDHNSPVVASLQPEKASTIGQIGQRRRLPPAYDAATLPSVPARANTISMNGMVSPFNRPENASKTTSDQRADVQRPLNRPLSSTEPNFQGASHNNDTRSTIFKRVPDRLASTDPPSNEMKQSMTDPLSAFVALTPIPSRTTSVNRGFPPSHEPNQVKKDGQKVPTTSRPNLNSVVPKFPRNDEKHNAESN